VFHQSYHHLRCGCSCKYFLLGLAIGRARQKKLSDDTSKACGILQSKELYNAKDEEKVSFHNDNITHLNDHVILNSGIRCSS
jgi:hypothetical protein